VVGEALQVQSPVAHVPSPQLRPQAPQFAASDCVFTQWMPHMVVGMGQEHSPFGGVPVTTQLAPVTQETPHSPQLFVSVLRSTQAPPQEVWPLGQPAVEVQLAAETASASAATAASPAPRRPTFPLHLFIADLPTRPIPCRAPAVYAGPCSPR
jgi:hypothetical protein